MPPLIFTFCHRGNYSLPGRLMEGMLFLILLVFSSGLQAQDTSVPELEKVRIALKWRHQFQFAGYYAAIEEGYYAEEGLEVELLVPEYPDNYLDFVLEGKAEYGTGETGLVLEALNGQPVVLLAQIFQHSPYVLVSKRGTGILEPRDLEGKRVMMSDNDADSASLIAMMKEAGVDFDKVDFVPLSYSLDEFINDQVDALAVYIADQPFGLRKRGIELNTIDPRAHGVDFYGDNLFCAMREISLHPGRAERVRRATLKGWKYALEHPDEIIDLILSDYQTDLSREHLEFESRLTAMMIIPDLAPLGDVNRERFHNIARRYLELGLAETGNIPDAFFHESAVRVPLTPAEREWLKENPNIRVGVTESWPPYDITTPEGNFEGINADYLKLIGERLGVEMIPVTRPSWKEVVEACRRGDVHCVPGLSINPERQAMFQFTVPYTFNPVVGVTRLGEETIKNWNDLSGKSIIAIDSSAIIHEIEESLEEIDLVLVHENEEGLQLLENGGGDVYLGWIGSVQYDLERMGLEDLQFAFMVENEESRFRFGINLQYPLLASAMDKAVRSISQLEHISIRQKWLGPQGGVSLRQPQLPELRSFDQVMFILKSLGAVFLIAALILLSAWIHKGCPRSLNIRYTMFGISCILICLVLGITTCIVFLFRENSELTRVEYAAIESVESMFDDAQSQYLILQPSQNGIEKIYPGGDMIAESRESALKTVEQFFNHLESQVRDELERAHNRTDVVIQVIMTLTLITIGFLGYVLYLMKKRIVYPLLLLGKSIRIIEDGDYGHTIALDTADEVGDLARAFNRMTAQVRENYSKLKSVIEATSDGILVTDMDGSITSYNERFVVTGRFDRKQLGKIQDVSGMYQWCRQNLKNADEIISLSQAGFNNPENKWHCTIYLKDNRIIEAYSFPQWHGDRVIGRVLSIRDVTERTRAEEQLQKLSQALEQSPTAVGITNMKGMIEYVNTAFTRLTGYSSEELIGANVRSLIERQLHPTGLYKESVAKLLSGESFKSEFRSTRKNGEVFWESVLLAPIRQKNGDIKNFVAVRMDITEVKKHQEALDLQNKRFRRLYEVVSNRELSQEEVLCSLIQVTREAFDMDYGYVGKVEKRIRTVQYVDPKEGGPQPGDSLDVSMACCGIVELKQEPFLISDLSMTHYKDSYCFQKQGVYAYAGTYIRTSWGNYGAFSLVRKTPREEPFTEQDRDLLLVVGELIGSSLDRLRSNQEIVERANDLESMNEAMVDRELRMIELKKEVNQLSGQLGLEPPYEMGWDQQDPEDGSSSGLPDISD